MKVLLILEKNSWKIENKTFSAVRFPHENWSFQRVSDFVVFCELL